jgi:hypothetical protein
MRLQQLLKRVAIDLGIIVGAVLVAAALLTGYFWVQGQLRTEANKEDSSFLSEAAEEANGLAALGDVKLDPPPWTLAVLEEKLHLHQRAVKPYGPQNNTNVGWACGKERCAVNATFLIPLGQAIPSNTAAAALMIEDPLLGGDRKVAVGGVRLRGTAEEMKEYCRNRGYGQEIGYHRIIWDKDWTLVWGEMNDKITFLSFTNDQLIRSARAAGGTSFSGSGNTDKGNSK